MLKYIGVGLADVHLGLKSWRIWTMLAWNDVRRRYRRSGLGQFWVTLSMAAMIGGLGFVYSQLFSVDVTTYLPYLAVTFVMWGMMSTCVIETCNAFNEGESLLRHMSLPRSLFVFRVIARTLIVCGHNIIIIPLVFLVFGKGLNANILWLVVGFALLLVNGVWSGFFLAIVCARFRDIPPIVTSVMQVVFFVTPVMFLPDQLSPRRLAALTWNPFAYLLEVVRDPLLGTAPSAQALLVCSVMAVLGLAVVMPFAGRYAPRAVYWL